MTEYFNLTVYLFTFLFIVVLITFLVLSNFTAAPFLPSSSRKSDIMIIEGNLKSSDIVFDLGSGDGRLVLMAAEQGVKRAVGFEINPLLLLFFSKLCAFVMKLDNAEFIFSSFWKADLSKCDKLFIYLLPSSMRKLEDKIKSEMRPGSLIISNQFRFPNLKIKKENKGVYVYEV